MSDIPEGAGHTVAAMAIAWEIVKNASFSNYTNYATQGADAVVEGMTQAYIKAYQAILKAAEQGTGDDTGA